MVREESNTSYVAVSLLNYTNVLGSEECLPTFAARQFQVHRCDPDSASAAKYKNMNLNKGA